MSAKIMDSNCFSRVRSQSVLLIAVAVLFQPAQADILLLRQGGQIEGKVSVKRDDRNRVVSYIVRHSVGQLKLDPSQVKRHVKPTKKSKTYEQLLQSMPDSADSHWEVAQFCRKHGLTDRKHFHIEQALRHDPDHKEARRSLGYIWRDGGWTRQEDEMTSRGYVLHKGKWRLPEDVQIQERKETIEEKTLRLRSEMKRWRSWMGGRQESQAIENFKTLNDPFAVVGLNYLLDKEDDMQMRELYIDAIARIRTSEATAALVNASLFDDDQELRLRAAEHLIKRPDKKFSSRMLLKYLNEKQPNHIINRAGYIVGRLRHRDSILPLIDALVTVHVKTMAAPQGNIRPTFSSGPNGSSSGLQMNQKPKKIRQTKKNHSILRALVSITDQNFQYSEDDWRNWYKSSRAPENFNLRRDL